MTSNPWPELPLAEWKDTFETSAHVDPDSRQNIWLKAHAAGKSLVERYFVCHTTRTNYIHYDL